MVTSNKLPEKKVVKMSEQNNSVVLPQRTLLGEVNEHITCPLCRGYYIDATTIVECLHSFCRSCIIKHLKVKSYCPECEMMINSAKPNIKPDKALQDIVYKLVPGLFQREMERRRLFYASRPGPAATATPEQRGEDTERIIFSPEDVISFSLEYCDQTDSDSISSKSSDSNEPQQTSATARRYLQCPAVVNISHLKKFITMKFDIDSTQFSIDILYKRVPLPDYYTLMDIAYIYNWKRNEPMRFFYQITDFIAIRTRYSLFEINRKGSQFQNRKSSPTSTEDANVNSPSHNQLEQGSEASSGTDSPMPTENVLQKLSDTSAQEISLSNVTQASESSSTKSNSSSIPSKKGDEDVEKSQFLNSFELTAKSNCSPKKSIEKDEKEECSPNSKVKENLPSSKVSPVPAKIDESLKRKQQSPPKTPEMKKLKVELEKPNSGNKKSMTPQQLFYHLFAESKKGDKTKEVKETLSNQAEVTKPNQAVSTKEISKPEATKEGTKEGLVTSSTISPQVLSAKETKPQNTTIKHPTPENIPLKRPVPSASGLTSPKRRTSEVHPTPTTNKTVSPLKLQIPKTDNSQSSMKSGEMPKHTLKKIPDLKPGVPSVQTSHNKGPPVGKLRMDLLANNSDPTIDRSKILSQVKTSLSQQGQGQISGDPLKSLFDSCKINIPSSLSITLTDQKLEQRNQHEAVTSDSKKAVVNKNLSVGAGNNSGTHKVPSPPVHNYIEILKLPDTDPKKQQAKQESTVPTKPMANTKSDGTTSSNKPATKSSESSAKGPIPSLKPIADAKLGKLTGNYTSPITFQQTFEQQLQSIQSEKTKLPKNKMQVPNLMLATPKALSAANKLNNKPNTPGSSAVENKNVSSRNDNALDLSTQQHNVQGQLGPQQSKTFETMQSIVNLAKKQNLPAKPSPMNMSQSVYSNIANHPNTGQAPMKIPPTTSSSSNQIKSDKVNNPSSSQMNSSRHDMKSMKPNSTKYGTGGQYHNAPPNYQGGSLSSLNAAQPSPRQQTRSPSSSPKLVIAEDKQNQSANEVINQSNQISSTQLNSAHSSKTESPKSSPGPSKQAAKPVKSLLPPGKMPGIRQPMPMNSTPDFQFIAQHAMLRQHLEIQQALLKAQRYMSHQSNNNDHKQ